jgi:hypothetical protein
MGAPRRGARSDVAGCDVDDAWMAMTVAVGSGLNELG